MMKKINIGKNFFDDILFNEFSHKKYLLMDKLLLIGGVFFNVLSFFLYSLTGNTLFHEFDFYLRIFNALIVTGILAIKHRVKVNYFNISCKLSELEYDNDFSMDIKDIEILPLNFEFNEELPLSMLKKIYEDGAYIILKNYNHDFTFFIKDTDAYLMEDDDIELEEVKKLRLNP